MAARKSRHSSKQSIKKILDIVKEDVWWQRQWNVEDFHTVCFEGKFYAKLDCWKDNIWIGAYDSEDELNQVLVDYSKLTKSKAKFKKEIPNLHSIIKKINDTNQ